MATKHPQDDKLDQSQQTGTQGSRQGEEPLLRESNDLTGGYHKRDATNHLSADENMDDDTGLSNRANRQSAVDQGAKQMEQSNVGRRDDGTPD